MNTQTDARPDAVAGPVERPVRPLLERLRDVERDGMTFAGEAANEIEALRAAITEWQTMAMAERQRGVAAERERCAQVVRDFPHWIGPHAKRELLAAMLPGA